MDELRVVILGMNEMVCLYAIDFSPFLSVSGSLPTYLITESTLGTLSVTSFFLKLLFDPLVMLLQHLA